MASTTDFTAAQLLELAETDIDRRIHDVDAMTILSKPPFLSISGTFNLRDLGRVPGSTIRPGYAFRSGMLQSSAANDLVALAQTHGIKWVFDLRAEMERAKSPEPNIIGTTKAWLPNTDKETFDVRDFISGGGEEGYCKMYMNVLQAYGPSFRMILEHVRDRAEEPFLFHCTYGRDRTGIVAGLLMSLAGASDETVLLDYMLTRVGSEPAREMLFARASSEMGCDSFEVPGFYNLCSLRKTSWVAFLKELQNVYGGFEGFITSKLGFGQDEVEQIKKNLQR